MNQSVEEVSIEISARDGRELLSRLCRALHDAWREGERWTGGCEVRHWHARADAFADLPAEVVSAVVDEWIDAGGQLCDVDFSGYLTTDDGHRAWGFIATRPGPRPVGDRPEVKQAEVGEVADRLTLTCRIGLVQRAEEGSNG